jgi:protein gp37
MSDNSKIEWTEATWNPVAGCALVESALTKPLGWKRPRRIFVNSMSDLFHEAVPDSYIDKVFAVMALAPQHTFQVLTKRADRMQDYCRRFAPGHAKFLLSPPGAASARATWPLPNVWLGVSVEDQARADERIPLLLDTPAAVRWISAEPLLGPVDLTRIPSPVVTEEDKTMGYFHSALIEGDEHYYEPHPGMTDSVDGPYLPRLDWVVAGGESGPKARPMHPDWARALRDQCAGAGVPFFFKQWGEHHPTTEYRDGALFMSRVGKHSAGRVLDGRTHDEYPR